MSESYAGKINRKLLKKRRIINAAAGREPADLVLKNATYVNVFSNELCHADIAVAEGLIVGMGQYSGTVEEDCTGKIVLPGFLDAHIHLESSLVSPKEFVKAVLPHGTTTVITDPHEIANVMGTDGIEYMLQATEDLPVDVRFMLPSCVPATPLDESGAVLDYRAIDSFYDHPRVQGLAEMMNFVGIIAGPRAGPGGQRPERLHRRRRLLRPRVSRLKRRHRQAGAGPVHHDPGGHRRPESGRPGPPAVR
ncbi:amidohydrolase family protein, partial [uncultured Oscillibacter sp.]|uniref:amidohydrolase family protein n=1 Tax=uncultured Oscillibacter sp. TaxID=876091 RepID=UPI003429C090